MIQTTANVMQDKRPQYTGSIRAIIIDDERSGRIVLQKMIQEYCKEVEIVAIAESAKEGRTFINDCHPDIVFLDIEMPFQNGFELLDSISERNFEVIFVTAHESYVSLTKKYSPVALLLKPFNRTQLKNAIALFRERRN